MVTRIGVDIGGTFTDLVYFDERTGRTAEGKVPTTPANPETGVIDAVRRHVPADVLADAGYFLHGTTVGLNALLERRGATVGLLATEGLRDVLEIRRGDRAEMYNPFWQQPEPLVPRHLRLGVAERMRADGAVHRPLQPETVTRALAYFREQQVDAIAVCLMNAYANPAHELEIEALLRAAGFAGGISLSHRISGEYREYERTSTTVIDAFVRGRMADYLQRLETSLRGLGFRGQCLITRSGSGSMAFDEAERRPFETIMSGPVAGAQGAAEFARMFGIPALITADVGGTSFDTTLIIDGEPKVEFEGMVDGMPVQTPWVDVRSIGAGGGSIAAVDHGGLMRVGPRSAGAVPGPAAYGKGGTEPTTTDAAAHLGMLGPGRLAGGITLDFARAKAAIETVGAGIGKTAEETAIGILRIAAASMANAMREVTVEQGLDPRGMTLLPFGGAGPLMATLLADELAMRRIIVPPLAGNFSAWGLLGADMVQSAARTAILPLDKAGLATAETLLGALFGDLEGRAANYADTPAEKARLDLRYTGQEHWLSIEVPIVARRFGEDPATITGRFEAEYERTFGGLIEGPVEIVSVRASRTMPLPRRRETPAAPVAAGAPESWKAHSFARNQTLNFRVVARETIAAPFSGPAIVTETTATLYVDAGWRVAAGSLNELILTRE
jgi:N-methylhydantoinase A